MYTQALLLTQWKLNIHFNRVIPIYIRGNQPNILYNKMIQNG